MFRRLTFQTRLLFAFAFTSVITLGVGIVSYHYFLELSTHLTRTTRVDMPASLSLMMADMKHDALCAAAQRALLLAESHDENGAKSVADDIREAAAVFNSSLGELDALPLDSETRKAIAEIRPHLEKYVADARHIGTLAFQDRPAALKEMPLFDIRALNHLIHKI